LVDNGLLPPEHKTIPKIFDSGRFLGGFTELLEKLKRENIVTDQIIADVEKEIESSSIDFNKNDIRASVNLEKSSLWRTRDEYIESASDEAKLTFHYTPPEIGQVSYLYLIVEPPKIPELENEQKSLNEQIESNNLKAIFDVEQGTVNYQFDNEIINKSKPENIFIPKLITATIEGENENTVEIAYPDRYYMGKIEYGSICHLTFQSNIKVFTFFITTEPPTT